MDERQQKLSELKCRVETCEKCALCRTRTQTVFGRGSKNPAILFIGEAPGEWEDREGIPFVGPAGKLLDSYLDFIDLEEEEYFIANILKCRPPRNRDPLPEEEEACMEYLREQVKLLCPEIIVCLGRIAAQRILSPEFRITRDHGVWYHKGQVSLIATFHPSALLRDPSKKEAALDDFKKIREELEKRKQQKQ